MCLMLSIFAGHNFGSSMNGLNEELLFLFPVVNIVYSPCKVVKHAATSILLVLGKMLIDSLSSLKKGLSVEGKFPAVSKPESILYRFLLHMWFQVISAIFSSYIISWLLLISLFDLSTVSMFLEKAYDIVKANHLKFEGTHKYIYTISYFVGMQFESKKIHQKMYRSWIDNWLCSFQDQPSLTGTSYLSFASLEASTGENGHSRSKSWASLLGDYSLQIYRKMKSSLPLSQTEELFIEGN